MYRCLHLHHAAHVGDEAGRRLRQSEAGAAALMRHGVKHLQSLCGVECCVNAAIMNYNKIARAKGFAH